MSSSDEAPEEKSFKKGKEQHLEIESSKIKKKRKKNETIEKQNEIIQVKKEKKVVVNTEFEEKESKKIEGLEIKVLKKDAKPIVDTHIKDWLQVHFYGPRLKRQSTNEWLSNKREKAGTRINFLEK